MSYSAPPPNTNTPGSLHGAVLLFYRRTRELTDNDANDAAQRISARILINEVRMLRLVAVGATDQVIVTTKAPAV